MDYFYSHPAGVTLAAGVVLEGFSIGARQVNNTRLFIKQRKTGPAHEGGNIFILFKHSRQIKIRRCCLRFRRLSPVINNTICPGTEYNPCHSSHIFISARTSDVRQ